MRAYLVWSVSFEQRDSWKMAEVFGDKVAELFNFVKLFI